MSLHCPATLLVTTPGLVTDLDTEALLERRVGCVYADADEAGTGVAAKEQADALGVPVRTVAGLGAEADDEQAMHDALESIADLHRGETVLVVGHSLVEALPHLALDRRGRSVGGAFTVLECGEDGWALLPPPSVDAPASAPAKASAPSPSSAGSVAASASSGLEIPPQADPAGPPAG